MKIAFGIATEKIPKGFMLLDNIMGMLLLALFSLNNHLELISLSAKFRPPEGGLDWFLLEALALTVRLQWFIPNKEVPMLPE